MSKFLVFNDPPPKVDRDYLEIEADSPYEAAAIAASDYSLYEPGEHLTVMAFDQAEEFTLALVPVAHKEVDG